MADGYKGKKKVIFRRIKGKVVPIYQGKYAGLKAKRAKINKQVQAKQKKVQSFANIGAAGLGTWFGAGLYRSGVQVRGRTAVTKAMQLAQAGHKTGAQKIMREVATPLYRASKAIGKVGSIGLALATVGFAGAIISGRGSQSMYGKKGAITRKLNRAKKEALEKRAGLRK